jgi:short-subunit dehydrogenase
MPGATLITGCSSGIGRALAEEFNRRGHVVYATARRIETLDDLKARGIRTAALDVNDQESIEALMGSLAEDGMAIETLVNNAGYGAMGPLAELPPDELQRQFDTNVFAVVALIQAVVPGMAERRSGRIVNIGSVSGVLPSPFSGAYSASKAAVHALSDSLRVELAPFGIHVITVQPGAIESRFGATAGAEAARRSEALSLYAPVADAIAARSEASQQRPTPADVFARKLVDSVSAENPRPLVRIGRASLLLPLMKQWLPTRVLDRGLSRRFGLDRLRR